MTFFFPFSPRLCLCVDGCLFYVNSKQRFIYKYIVKFAGELHRIKQWAKQKKDNSESHFANENGETPLAGQLLLLLFLKDVTSGHHTRKSQQLQFFFLNFFKYKRDKKRNS